jgi:hypothetical protein
MRGGGWLGRSAAPWGEECSASLLDEAFGVEDVAQSIHAGRTAAIAGCEPSRLQQPDPNPGVDGAGRAVGQSGRLVPIDHLVTGVVHDAGGYTGLKPGAFR